MSTKSIEALEKARAVINSYFMFTNTTQNMCTHTYIV